MTDRIKRQPLEYGAQEDFVGELRTIDRGLDVITARMVAVQENVRKLKAERDDFEQRLYALRHRVAALIERYRASSAPDEFVKELGEILDAPTQER